MVAVDRVQGYVVTWDEVRTDGQVFLAGSIIDPAAVVGSVVSLDLDYQRSVGTVVVARNDEVGCLVEIDLADAAHQTPKPRLEGVFAVRKTTTHPAGGDAVARAFLLHVSITSHRTFALPTRSSGSGPTAGATKAQQTTR